jgi:hypothetical protein
MKRWLLIFALVGSCLAQTQGNLPTLVDAINGDASNGGSTTTISKYVVTGDMLVGLIKDFTGTTTATDTCGSTFAYVNFTFDETPIGRGGPYPSRMFYGTAVCTGLDTVTLSVPIPANGSIGLTELTSGLTFDASGTATASTGATITVSATSTVIGDIGVAAFVNAYSINGVPISPAQAAGDYTIGNDQNHIMAWNNFGATGSQSIAYQPLLDPANSGNFGGGGAIILFKHALAVATTLMPNADQVQAYAATLRAVGGTGSYTWTVQTGSLPTGLSLNASTGAITGTASGATGNYPITFRVTESGGGTHADSTGLSINVGAAFGTPTVIQSAFSTTTVNSLALGSAATSGHTLLVLYKGEVRHGSEGYVNPSSGTGGGISDSRGTVFTRGLPINPAGVTPIYPYTGCLTSSGADTVSMADNQSLGSGSAMAIVELSNTQQVLDLGTFTTVAGNATSPFTMTTPSYTVPVNNMALFSINSVEGGVGRTTTPVAPFTLLGTATSACSFGCFDLSTDFGVAAGTATASATITASSFSNQVQGSELIFGLRPDISGLPCGGTPVASGSIRHRSEVY